MIDLVHGDILEADAEALVNPVNCVGVMGRGLAAHFKRAYPSNFEAYAKACDRGVVRLGSMFSVSTGELFGPRHVINFPTKRHWRDLSRMKDIERGLDALVAEVDRLGLGSVVVPALGCGLGGLAWARVRPKIEQAFAGAPARILLYGPA